MKLKFICPDGDPQEFQVVTEDGQSIENTLRIEAVRDRDDPTYLEVTLKFFVRGQMSPTSILNTEASKP